MTKCKFFQESVEYLGKDGIQALEKKIKGIKSVPSPTDVTKLRSFLGMVNQYGKFVKSLTDLSAPLNQLLKKDEPWNWTDTCQKCFLMIKEALTSTDVLAHFDPLGWHVMLVLLEWERYYFTRTQMGLNDQSLTHQRVSHLPRKIIYK